MSPADPKRVMVIAGEASGEQHGAKVVTALREKCPGLSFLGIGGPAMRAAGVHILVDAHDLAVVGITEIFSKSATILKGLAVTKRALKRLKPDLLILIDFPDFNLHVAATAKRLGIPVLYYISPQIWAWRSGRAKKIRRRVDHMAVILPFEAEFYHRYQVPVTFVGHPLLDSAASGAVESDASFDPHRPTIGFLPGSRDKEVLQLLPDMLESARLLKQKIPGARFLISLAPSVKKEIVEGILSVHGKTLDYDIEPGGSRPVFHRSTVVVAASGTVTLEAAMAGVPMVIVYKVSPLSYRLGRALIRVEHIGLANLIAGRRIVPELIQQEVTGENIADTLHQMLSHPVELTGCRQALMKLRHELGGPGASGRVADIAARMLGISVSLDNRTPETRASN
jgi:lipid-A-disaccharide synthase